jgi:signal transduction histidine kinase
MMKRMEGDSPDLAPLRQIIERQLEQLKSVITDMRDVTRVTQARALELEKEALPVDRLIRLAVEAAQPTIESRGHRLQIDLPQTPCTVWGDPARLSQALAHLLSNAAKFTPAPDRIDLRVEADGTTVRLHVVDRGQGISHEFLPEMFEPFAQECHATPRTNHGLGVGLTIAKRLAELHGGEVTGTSEGPGRGAEFVLSLPCMQQPDRGDRDAR